jgi:hypothetical protein
MLTEQGRSTGQTLLLRCMGQYRAPVKRWRAQPRIAWQFRAAALDMVLPE